MRSLSVLWNGRKDSPGGRQLFTEEYEPIHPEPHVNRAYQARSDDRKLIMELLRRKPRTLRELVEASEIDAFSVADALKVFRNNKTVETCELVKIGRRVVHRYALTNPEVNQ